MQKIAPMGVERKCLSPKLRIISSNQRKDISQVLKLRFIKVKSNKSISKSVFPTNLQKSPYLNDLNSF
jgi:hypothetical protein